MLLPVPNQAIHKQRKEKEYPTYSGQNYLDMTAGFFFAE